MMKLQKWSNIFMLLLILHTWTFTIALSNLRRCADPDCLHIISIGTGKINYNPGEKGMVSFKVNSKINIKSKSAGTDPSLWGVEVNGRQGYAPKEFILENRILISEQNLEYIVPVSLPDENPIGSIVLNTSEGLIAMDNTESTTTAPLGNVKEKDAVNNVSELTSTIFEQSTPSPTPVHKIEEIVDGTRIPIQEEIKTNSVDTKHVMNIKRDTQLSNNLNTESIHINTKDQGSENAYDKDTDESSYRKDNEEHHNNDVEFKVGTESIERDDKDQITKNEVYDIDTDESNYKTDNMEHHVGDVKLKVMVSSKFEGQTSKVHMTVGESISLKSDNFLSSTESVKPTESTIEVQEDIETQNITQDRQVIESKNETEETVIESSRSISDKIEGNNIDSNKLNIKLNSGHEENLNVVSFIGKELLSDNDIINNRKGSENVISEEQETVFENEKENVTPISYLTKGSHDKIYDSPFDQITTASSILYGETVNYNAVEVVNKQQGLESSDIYVKLDEAPAIQKLSKSSMQSIDSPNVPAADDKVELSRSTRHEKYSQENIKLDHSQNHLEELVPESSTTKVNKVPNDIKVHSEVTGQTPIHTLESGNSLSNTGIFPNSNYEPYTENINAVGRKDNKQYSDNLSIQKSLLTNDELPLETSVNYQANVNIDSSYSSKKFDDLSMSQLNHIESNLYVPPNEDTSTVAPSDIELESISEVDDLEKSKEHGLFATILGSVNNFISSGRKEIVSQDNLDVHEDNELKQILFSKKSCRNIKDDISFCEQIFNDSPKNDKYHENLLSTTGCKNVSFSEMSFENMANILFAKLLEMSDLLACLMIISLSLLLFIFGYYCFCNRSREGTLLAKLNTLERSLLASQKENSILKDDLGYTRNKLASIEDCSFGSDDVVVALKNDLEEEVLMKKKLQEQIIQLERELEAAAEAGLELNKIVSELLSNQTGDVSIISSVEELQKQLNQQQNTILEINTTLAEKSRQNSELQLMLSEQSSRLTGEITSLKQENDELEAEKEHLQMRLEEIKNEFEGDMKSALESKNFEIKRLQNEMLEMVTKMDENHNKLRTSLAKVEALEDCLRTVKRDPSINILKVLDVANVRAELLNTERKYKDIKEQLDIESDGKKMLASQLEVILNEMEKLKYDFNQSEKDKLEAQTRLEVLSNYFREKEMQLQKELSLKEAIWLKQQGETISTVDRVTAMQNEVTSLKSQNESLRAEIEAQLAAHKAQIGTLENRAHETWLAGRQTERRYEEVRAEAAALRRKLTSLMGGNVTEINLPTNSVVDVKIVDQATAPSPISMEQPDSPLMGRLPPPPPPFLPPPFIPPFMGIPPHFEPFVPSSGTEIRPIGRIMSPPLPLGSGPIITHAHTSRYSPDMMYYDDTYIDDDDIPRRRRHNGNRGNWKRGSDSPPRSYRSDSPTDSRYNYADRDLISTIDTETDISPPPSPRPSHGSHSDKHIFSSPLTTSSPIDDNSHRNGHDIIGNKKQRTSNINKSTFSSGSDSSNQRRRKVKSKS